jgi:hypothetical protein
VSTASQVHTPDEVGREQGLASLAVNGASPAARAELLQLKAVGIIATVLLGDVVALFAINASHGDLRPDIGALACHGLTPFRCGPPSRPEVKITRMSAHAGNRA